MLFISLYKLQRDTYLWGSVKITNHQPTNHQPLLTNPPTTFHLTTDRPSSANVKTEDQIPNMFCSLEFFKTFITNQFLLLLKVACRVQIWEKHFVKIATSFVTVFLKMTLCLCIYFIFTKKIIILNLFKIDTLNFTTHILANLTFPLKTNVRLHNLISTIIFFRRSQFFFIIVKRKPKSNRLKKPFKNSDFFKSNFNEYFLHNKGFEFYFVIVKKTLENE